ncbi:hypothetical protein QJS83_17005 [Bdellovibrio sp. 22V]|uniref:hypothetical protein n=1 Tax=Bdellovibrio sp. 22V TaxID=3044166 RepID=UPI00254318C7|nr:hypothetical protein [Bdellovibrio sp. 22V]WII72164.1 hypothetical protein QJS83_17005 [Bdellovibrio sp. 22V]
MKFNTNPRLIVLDGYTVQLERDLGKAIASDFSDYVIAKMTLSRHDLIAANLVDQHSGKNLFILSSDQGASWKTFYETQRGTIFLYAADDYIFIFKSNEDGWLVTTYHSRHRHFGEISINLPRFVFPISFSFKKDSLFVNFSSANKAALSFLVKIKSDVISVIDHTRHFSRFVEGGRSLIVSSVSHLDREVYDWNLKKSLYRYRVEKDSSSNVCQSLLCRDSKLLILQLQYSREKNTVLKTQLIDLFEQSLLSENSNDLQDQKFKGLVKSWYDEDQGRIFFILDQALSHDHAEMYNSTGFSQLNIVSFDPNNLHNSFRTDATFGLDCTRLWWPEVAVEGKSLSLLV